MHKDRAIWASVAVLCLAFAAVMLRETGGAGWMPGCFFRKATGLECPGCGMTRGTYAILHGRFLEGFLFNPVGMILLAFASLAVGLQVIGWVMGRPSAFHLNTGRWGALIVVVVMISWWIFRNLKL